MPYGEPLLSDLEIRYPFAPKSRKFFESIPVEDGLASKEVIAQTENRLLGALGRTKYEPHISQLIEFSSFFAAALVASQDTSLASKFSRREAERARQLFAREAPPDKATVMSECFGLRVEQRSDMDGQPEYVFRFEEYLFLVSKFEMTKSPKWKLSRQALQSGTVYLSENMLNDMFGDCAQAAIAEGARNLRKAPFPRQLQATKNHVIQYVPPTKAKAGKGYLYVEELLKHPVSDGRHRLIWLVLAPYLVNVKKVEDEEAIDKIRSFVSVAGETSNLKRFAEYNVRRARRNGLLPPTFSTLKTEHPDIYALLPKEVLAEELVLKPRSSSPSRKK
ncbi:MAG TPA: DNA primase noncatalytic subunit PriX [Nitrososphaerales archaeon]|nr:DNA primase noncatalytic subunit PriX [Nitrososphaerales archaeon]